MNLEARTYASVLRLKVKGMKTMKGLPRMGVPSNGTKRVKARSSLQDETAGKTNRFLRDKLPLPDLTPKPPSRSRFRQPEVATERGSASPSEFPISPTRIRRTDFILAGFQKYFASSANQGLQLALLLCSETILPLIPLTELSGLFL